MPDPLTELVHDLTTRREPSREWVQRWSRFGFDPVALAWSASSDPFAMVRLLGFCRSRFLSQISCEGSALGPNDPSPTRTVTITLPGQGPQLFHWTVRNAAPPDVQALEAAGLIRMLVRPTPTLGQLP